LTIGSEDSTISPSKGLGDSPLIPLVSFGRENNLNHEVDFALSFEFAVQVYAKHCIAQWCFENPSQIHAGPTLSNFVAVKEAV
jgi:hypothetical protein